jgi:hypothetical protein
MGMTDDVICEFPLAEPRHQDLRYQTKQLLASHQLFRITRDGRLMQDAKHSTPALARDMEWPLGAELEFHTSLATPQGREWISYVARFEDGRVESIRRNQQAQQVPTPRT